ncbi:hypothetical protein FRD01_22730 [Microvenator marinus]|uniref:Uncharacterized protein n=1 Tax=Microvenator marinus TaxID=2600177 RepID=A0A5B8Y218_9DELT|nr:hypothetical protein [Microvenator marinus]QED29996.1 hypothetical protein FRD01_22730 [Microvenator marinus]
MKLWKENDTGFGASEEFANQTFEPMDPEDFYGRLLSGNLASVPAPCLYLFKGDRLLASQRFDELKVSWGDGLLTLEGIPHLRKILTDLDSTMQTFLVTLALFALSCSASTRGAEPALTPETVATPAQSRSVEDAEPLLMDSLKVYGRVVFHDELVAAGDALALKLGEFGPFRPIHDSASPYTDLLNEWTRVAQGNYVKEGQCFDPPSPALAMRALNPDAVGAEIGIRCTEKCVLTVTLRDAETKAKGRDYFDRARSKWTLELDGDVDTWAAQIANATFTKMPLEKPKNDGLGILGTLAQDSPGIMVRDAEFSGEWGETYSRAAFDAVVSDFSQCAQEAKTWRDWWGMRHLLEVNAAGEVVRCEASLPDHLPRTNFACECDAIARKVNFGPGQERRMSAYINYYPGSSNKFLSSERVDNFNRSAYLADFSGDDPYASALGTNALSYEALRSCTKNLTETEQDVRVAFVIDTQGNTKSIEVTWPDELQDFGKCAQPILSQAKFSCPYAPNTVTGTLKIKVSPIQY